MTEDERRKRIHEILDKHDKAMALMRSARAASRRSVTAVERVDTSMGTSSSRAIPSDRASSG